MSWKKPTITQLRRELVADSIERKKAMDRLLKLVREEERAKTIADLEGVRARAEQR